MKADGSLPSTQKPVIVLHPESVEYILHFHNLYSWVSFQFYILFLAFFSHVISLYHVLTQNCISHYWILHVPIASWWSVRIVSSSLWSISSTSSFSTPRQAPTPPPLPSQKISALHFHAGLNTQSDKSSAHPSGGEAKNVWSSVFMTLTSFHGVVHMHRGNFTFNYVLRFCH